MYEETIKEYYSIIKNKIAYGNIKNALESTNQLLSNFPSDAYGYYFKGICFFALNSYDNAIKFYLMALKCNPTFAKAYFNLGVCYLMLQKKDLALVNIGKAFVLFTKSKDNEKKHRCLNALRFIGGSGINV